MTNQVDMKVILNSLFLNLKIKKQINHKRTRRELLLDQVILKIIRFYQSMN